MQTHPPHTHKHAQMSAGALTAALQQLAAEDSSDDDGAADEDEGRYSDNDSLWGGGAHGGGAAGDEVDAITAEEEAALARFMPPAEGQGLAAGGQKSLADMIVERIREKQQQQGIEVLAE
jgi:hypothetical protein